MLVLRTPGFRLLYALSRAHSITLTLDDEEAADSTPRPQRMPVNIL